MLEVMEKVKSNIELLSALESDCLGSNPGYAHISWVSVGNLLNRYFSFLNYKIWRVTLPPRVVLRRVNKLDNACKVLRKDTKYLSENLITALKRRYLYICFTDDEITTLRNCDLPKVTLLLRPIVLATPKFLFFLHTVSLLL